MLPPVRREPEVLMPAKPSDEVIASARQWQRWLKWLSWLLPVTISLGLYAFVWYRVVLTEESVEVLRQASNIVFFGALASMVLGIFLYQLQSILAQQVMTSAELEKKVAERTQDITEVIRQLDGQNQALKALDNQKSEFVTLVSHELRAPLTNINGGLELLLTHERDLSPRTRATLQLVVAEAGRLTHFVKTILDLSAIEAGQLPVLLEPTPVAAAVQHVAGQFGNLPPGRLVTDAPKNLPLVNADDRFLQSVIFHLVDNALKYAPDSPVWITAREFEGYVEVQVKDEGPGMSPEAAARLFKMFERLDVTDSQAVYGYGLGLYMCKRLMEALKGEISLETAEGLGTTFKPEYFDNPYTAFYQTHTRAEVMRLREGMGFRPRFATPRDGIVDYAKSLKSR